MGDRLGPPGLRRHMTTYNVAHIRLWWFRQLYSSSTGFPFRFLFEQQRQLHHCSFDLIFFASSWVWRVVIWRKFRRILIWLKRAWTARPCSAWLAQSAMADVRLDTLAVVLSALQTAKLTHSFINILLSNPSCQPLSDLLLSFMCDSRMLFSVSSPLLLLLHSYFFSAV